MTIFFENIKKDECIFFKKMPQKELDRKKMFVKDIVKYHFDEKTIYGIEISLNKEDFESKWQILQHKTSDYCNKHEQYFILSRILGKNEIKAVFGSDNIINNTNSEHDNKIFPSKNISEKLQYWFADYYLKNFSFYEGQIFNKQHKKFLSLKCWDFLGSEDNFSICVEYIHEIKKTSIYTNIKYNECFLEENPTKLKNFQ